MRIKQTLKLITAAAILLSLSGCLNNSEEPSKEEQNLAEIMGAVMVAGISQSGDLNNLLSTTDIAPDLHTSTALPAATLAKSSAADGEVVDIDSSRIAEGIATLTFTHTKLNQDVETLVLQVNAGPDMNFDAEDDNKIMILRWDRKRTGTVIASAEYADVDGDGYIMDNANSSPQIADLTLFESENPWKIFIASSSLKIRAEAAPGDTEGRIISLMGSETMKDGRINTVKVENSSGGQVIAPNEIVNVIITTEYPANQDHFQGKAVFVVDVGNGLQDETDNELHEIHVTTEPRFGQVDEWEFHFTTHEPVPHGQDPTSGEVQLIAHYKDGKTGSLIGSFDQNGFDIVITGPEGNTLTVKLDAEGKFIEGTSSTL